MKCNTELMSLLAHFQTAYDKRETEAVDVFLERCFHPDEFASIIGTSDCELCLDRESIKKLFVSDWGYWGDLKLDFDNAMIREFENSAWCHCPATVKHSFSDSLETDSAFVSFVGEFFDGVSYDSHKSTKVKLAEINWLLAHFLHPREPAQDRAYYWKARVFFVFAKICGQWFIKHIQFSFPKDSIFADARIHPSTYYESNYNREVTEYQKLGLSPDYTSVGKRFLEDFCTGSLVGGQRSALAIDFFTADALLIDVGSHFYRGSTEAASRVFAMNEEWDEIAIHKDACVFERIGDKYWMHTVGLMKRQIDAEQIYELTAQKVQSTLAKSMKDRDKLFVVRRDIATAFKELGYGHNYIYPYRLDAFIVREAGGLRFDYLQFSYPLDNVLEQINDDF